MNFKITYFVFLRNWLIQNQTVPALTFFVFMITYIMLTQKYYF